LKSKPPATIEVSFSVAPVLADGVATSTVTITLKDSAGAAVVGVVPQFGGSGTGNTSAYASYNGTSMATPHVTGAAALYKAINPAATASQIKSAILSRTTATSSVRTQCVTGGRLNVGGF
jgi:subtilisin family serine protease